jgi:acetolactate synthase I/III small subunit
VRNPPNAPPLRQRFATGPIGAPVDATRRLRIVSCGPHPELPLSQTRNYESYALNMRHIISLLMENEAGALSRVAGLFSARGYNIESLTVAPTEDATLSRMTIVTTGSEDVIEQIIKQLNKLVDVVKVLDLTDGNHIERELMLVKVRAGSKDREEMKRMADIFRGRIIDVTDKTYTIELTGPGYKLDAFLQALEATAILETVRTGASGIGRGERTLKI